jgi:hypothetical protein
MMLDLHSICLQIHYAMTPHRISLLLVVFTVNRSGWRFLSQQIPDLIDGEIRTGIGDADSVVLEFAQHGFGFKLTHSRFVG